MRHLANRDAPAALAELDATIHSGVEVGLLLDQLVGYFRDVMALAVGCKADQLLYALPSQADEVADIGRQLGLATILAIGQILDHTSARMRVSMHGRTLVEMAIVRICQLGELDDLASLVAELRGTPGEQSDNRVAGVESARGGRATNSLPSGSTVAHGSTKENAEPPATSLLAGGLADAVASAIANAPPQGRSDSAATCGRSARRRTRFLPNPLTAPAGESSPAESVLAQFQRAVAENGNDANRSVAAPQIAARAVGPNRRAAVHPPGDGPVRRAARPIPLLAAGAKT